MEHLCFLKRRFPDLMFRDGCRLRPGSVSDPELLPRELDVGGAASQVMHIKHPVTLLIGFAPRPFLCAFSSGVVQVWTTSCWNLNSAVISPVLLCLGQVPCPSPDLYLTLSPPGRFKLLECSRTVGFLLPVNLNS